MTAQAARGRARPAEPATRKPAPAPDDDPARRFPARRAVLTGLVGLALLVGGFGSWAALSNIAGAVVAPGRVVVETRQQVVQHLDGGIVKEILVQEGDRVEAGQPLLRFDDTLMRNEKAALEGQYWELLARRARLQAERDDAEEISFDPELVEAAAVNPKARAIVEGQRQLFEARRRTLREKIKQLRERRAQIDEQIAGAQAQADALRRQLALVEQELEGQRKLYEQGLAQLGRLLALQREEARLQGQVGELAAAIAEARGRAAEIEIQILELEAQRREDAIAQARDIQYQANQLRERLASLDERLERMEVRAPIGGVIHSMAVHAVRAVVRPGDPILYIVPTDARLLIEAQVNPADVDQIHPGQPATLRFPAFSSRTTPQIEGHVLRVSPDAFVDQATGRSWYVVTLQMDEGEEAKLGGLKLVPGMPAEAYIKTTERSPLSYLTKPLTDYFARALREG
ncbi:HlyD family type I secretion periplasmic adaptor subunit [Oceanicella actignis]|uniref:Membrane fusion protein (MFP) family protein n=1 Tax=Oceanicella actignis TaxID=1189325 RepID=A0A1M7RRJ7_9RHOB|nr:HlyD family type I secretion periplasmic adaptor subunit [Oceanicella actignis]SET06982.1 HlyD family secretion protein [Oceanicella actignis]SHN48869.1 HlyD family secretion protein [Oceanicella actignis]